MDQPDELVVLISVPTEMKASILLGVLKDAGIRATMIGEYTAGFRAEAPGWVKILVAREDLAQAKQAIKSSEIEGEVDWSAVDVGQPEEDSAD